MLYPLSYEGGARRAYSSSGIADMTGAPLGKVAGTGEQGAAVTFKLALLDDYQGIAATIVPWEEIDGVEVTSFDDHLYDEDEVAARLQPFDGVMAMRERTAFARSLLERLPNLKLLITTGPFNAVIDMQAAVDNDIIVCGTGGTAAPTAELTWGLILALARQIPIEDASIRSGAWQRSVGVELDGKTLGVIGLGNLGRRVAKVGLAFGMEVLAWSQNMTVETAEAAGALLVSRDELLERSTFVTIHLKLSERTTNLIGERELRLLGPEGYLVNTSRGPDRRRGRAGEGPRRGLDRGRRARRLRRGALAS